MALLGIPIRGSSSQSCKRMVPHLRQVCSFCQRCSREEVVQTVKEKDRLRAEADRVRSNKEKEDSERRRQTREKRNQGDDGGLYSRAYKAQAAAQAQARVQAAARAQAEVAAAAQAGNSENTLYAVIIAIALIVFFIVSDNSKTAENSRRIAAAQAQAFAQAVNTQTLCGHNNWRLPSKKELLSIVNYSKSYSAIDGAYFPNTQSGEYWSSSPDAHDSYRAWGVFFNRGQDSGDHKSNTLFVRLVRASQ